MCQEIVFFLHEILELKKRRIIQNNMNILFVRIPSTWSEENQCWSHDNPIINELLNKYFQLKFLCNLTGSHRFESDVIGVRQTRVLKYISPIRSSIFLSTSASHESCNKTRDEDSALTALTIAHRGTPDPDGRSQSSDCRRNVSTVSNCNCKRVNPFPLHHFLCITRVYILYSHVCIAGFTC